MAAAAPPHLDEVIGIGDSGLDQVIDAGENVEVGVLEVVPDHIAGECITVARTSAVIGMQDGIPLGSQYRHIVLTPAEPELVRGLGPAMRLDHEWVAVTSLISQ